MLWHIGISTHLYFQSTLVYLGIIVDIFTLDYSWLSITISRMGKKFTFLCSGFLWEKKSAQWIQTDDLSYSNFCHCAVLGKRRSTF